MNQVQHLVDHFFRHESSKMIASLTKIFGLSSIDLAEEVVQETLIKALQIWSYKGIPENPQAWLYRVARNHAIDIIRRERKFISFDSENSHLLKSEWTLSTTIKNEFTESKIEDDQLRMIFACCHPKLPIESQIVFALKTLFSFSVYEISRALLSSVSNVNKRLYRAKEKFRKNSILFSIPKELELAERLDSVYHVIYLIFNEGYYSSSGSFPIKLDLCEEAIHLAVLLFERNNSDGKLSALLALMCFQASRFGARLSGKFISLEKQDRTKWNQDLIAKGFYYLSHAGKSKTSSYHLEALIAYEHVRAKNFCDVNWENIINYYNILFNIKASPLILLNKGIALFYSQRKIDSIRFIKNIKGLEKNHLYYCTLGKFYKEKKQYKDSRTAYQKALTLVKSEHEKNYIQALLN